MNALQGSIEKAATLIEALPYIQKFRGKIAVVKYGGSTMVGGQEEDTVLKDVVFMASVGICPVIVHGGGPAINRRLEEQGVETQRINGLRVTDRATMEVVEDVLFGEVNAGIVRDIKAVGGKAVGLSGKDAGVLNVHKHWANTADGQVDIGFVGDVERVYTEPIIDLIEGGMIPVIAPIGRGQDGQSYNVNADTAAGEIAAALCAEKLVLLTDVTGIMRNPSVSSTLISTLHILNVEDLIKEAVISGGMIPKVKACVKAVESGVRKTHVVDGRIPHSMLLEIFTREGIGTEIVQ